MERLLHSSKFLILVMDTIITLILFFVGQADPAATDKVQFVITALQPIFVVIIGAVAAEDYAAKAAGQGAVGKFILKPSASGDWSSVNIDKDAHSKS